MSPIAQEFSQEQLQLMQHVAENCVLVERLGNTVRVTYKVGISPTATAHLKREQIRFYDIEKAKEYYNTCNMIRKLKYGN